MWIFTRYGFFSAVCARRGDGSHSQEVDSKRIMVRARLRSHLEALRNLCSELLENCEIREFKGSDYAFRIFVEKEVWSQVLVALNEELDYDNFKSEAARFQGPKGSAYVEALHDVWGTMNRLQPRTVHE